MGGSEWCPAYRTGRLGRAGDLRRQLSPHDAALRVLTTAPIRSVRAITSRNRPTRVSVVARSFDLAARTTQDLPLPVLPSDLQPARRRRPFRCPETCAEQKEFGPGEPRDEGGGPWRRGRTHYPATLPHPGSARCGGVIVGTNAVTGAVAKSGARADPGLGRPPSIHGCITNGCGSFGENGGGAGRGSPDPARVPDRRSSEMGYGPCGHEACPIGPAKPATVATPPRADHPIPHMSRILFFRCSHEHRANRRHRGQR